jgi:hypothetical protein
MPILRAHDRFYTRVETARLCIQKVNALPLFRWPNALFLEPSAGAGAFLDLLPEESRLGLDIEPKHPEVIEQDFLGYELPEGLAHRPVIVVGNPPFGRNSSLAVKFINKAATLADVVAFILPKTFQKASTIRRIDRRLHLLEEHPLPSHSFIFEGLPWDVSCVFQIWERRAELRVDGAGLFTHDDFQFVKRSEADFAIRRVGRSAGIVLREFASYSRTSHHFVKARDSERVIRTLNSVDWSEVRSRTAGIPCVGKEEVVRLYSEERERSAKWPEDMPQKIIPK